MVATPVWAGELLLGAAGKSNHQIVIPDKFPDKQIEQSVQQAAELMQRAFSTNGVALEIVAESKASADRAGIYVGQTEFARKQGIDFAGMEGWTYAFKVVGRDLIVAGNDRLDPIPIEKRREREARQGGIPFLGTLKGVTEFLYQYVGTRFLLPGSDGMEFLPTPVIYVPDDLSVVKRTYGQDIEVSKSKDIYFIANGLEPMPTMLSNYGHYHQTVISAKEYGESHPEYFAYQGRRRNNRGTHLCFSNPEVRELIYQKVLEDCDKGYDIIEMGQNDGFQGCGCDQCLELYGIHVDPKATRAEVWAAWDEKLWIMHRDMALRLEKDRPGKKLMISAYSVTRPPPKTIDRLPESAMVQMMSPTPEIFAEWKRIAVPGGYAAYTYTWGRGSFTPKNTVRTMKALVETLVDNKIQAVQNNGKPLDYGIAGVNIYVFRRLMNDPQGKSAEELFDEYIEAAYREASAPMKRFFQVLQQRLDFRKQAAQFGVDNRNPLLPYGAIYTPEFLNDLDRLLERAEQIEVSKPVQARLAKTRFEFNFIKSLVDTMVLYYAYQTHPDAVSWDRVLSSLEERNASMENPPKGKRPSFTNYDAKMLKTIGVDVEPFTWDTARLRKEGFIAEEREVQKITVPRVTQSVALDSPFWKELPSHNLQLPRGVSEPLQAATSIQLAYDDQNLYVRVEAELPAALMDSFHPRGRDEELWLQESFNLLLAPSGFRSQYFYLTYEPVADSFIDANHGFITDPLAPQFGWNDQSWDGDWTYVNELQADRNRWVSLVTIPFATLETPAPKSGAIWAANFGRVHYKAKIEDSSHSAMIKNRETSVWTGILNASRNPGDASMGDLVFE